ncbi:Uracil-DNA glycosylase, family 1 [hydrothermal vent metagenome]|uniref:Uracil-DNA glycosylase, family 1 n=1 Tax=hydrothermal vent metagenome TaxID=652676 RepID=A0A1W1EAK0_9ZZZZ
MTSTLPSDWRPVIENAYYALEDDYRTFLERDMDYIPDRYNCFNAFCTLPKAEVKYILFGQDPYPRAESAGGYAFIDMKVKEIFSPTGLSKTVNRATSLRNFVKMALVARGDLSIDDTSQEAISSIDKTSLINTIEALRQNFEREGVLLLNTALIFTDKKSSARHIKAWRPFMQTLLEALTKQAPKLILFGSHAQALKRTLPLAHFDTIEVEHPYNQSFIANKKVHELFSPMRLLEK